MFSNIGDYHNRLFLSRAPQQQDRLHFFTDKALHCSERAAQVVVEQLIAKLHAENWQVRQTAAEALQRVREWVPVEPVLACLHDKESGVRCAIVELLGTLEERVPVDAFLGALGDENYGVRASAEKMLLQNRERIPAARLIPLLHAEDWRTRTSAAKVLAQMGVRVPVEPFLADLNERDWERRGMGVEVLGELGADAPIEALFAVQSDWELRAFLPAASALRKALRNISAYVPLERLVKALSDNNPRIREAALTVLEYRNFPQMMLSESTTTPAHSEDTSVNIEGRHTSSEADLRTLVDLVLPMLWDNDPLVPNEAARVLARLSRYVPVPVEPLVAALNNEDATVSAAAVAVLGNRQGGVPIELLLKVLGNEDKYVREAAAKVLGKRGKRPREEFLLVGLGRHLSWMQATAAQLLCNMSEHVPIQVFEGMLTHEHAQVRARAAKALGQRSEQASVKPLLVALQDEDIWVRVAAVEALRKFGERTPLEPLVSMLNDEELRVRKEVARTLGVLGERVSLEPFLQALGDERAFVRAAAANVLGELGPRAPVEPLLDALHDPEPSVRRWAAWALGKLKKPAAIEPLLAALQDERDEVRSAASEALMQLAEDVPLESLLALLAKGDEKIDIAVWQVVANLGKPLPVEMVAHALDHPEEQVRLAAIKLIGEMREATLVDRLLNSLNEIRESLVQSAINPFQDLYSSQGFTHDFRMERISVNYDNRNIYSVTLEALSQLAGDVPIESLRQAVKSKQWPVRQAAVILLGQRKEQASVEVLLTTLDDNDSSVKVAAVRVLTGLGVDVPIERLSTLLREGSINERLEAALALRAKGHIPGELLLALLEDVQNDKQIPTRRAALLALGILEEPVPIEPLVATLGDSDYSVRDAAMKMLYQTHPEALLAVVPEAIAIVQGGESGNVLGSMEQGVIAEAIGNLGYGSPILFEKLTQLLDWPYWEVRMKAAQALGNIRRNIPDATILRLLELRHDAQSRTVCVAANDALAEILSLETGIEDD